MSERTWTAAQLENLSLSDQNAVKRIDAIDEELRTLYRRAGELRAERAELSAQVWG
jgi:hypothetical protein